MVYKEVKLECGYRLDLLVEGRVVVELKSVENFAPVHEAIMLTYLRLSGYRLGLLINFNVTVLEGRDAAIRSLIAKHEKL